MPGAEQMVAAETAPAQGQDDYPGSKSHAWYLLGLLMLLMAFGLMDRIIIGTLFPRLKQEWGLSDGDLGVLVSATYWSMAILSIPMALLSDRWSRTRAITLMALMWTFATVGCGLARSFVQLFGARVVIGAGEGGFNASAVSMLSGVFPERLRATAISLFYAAGTAGSVVGVALGGYVAARWGWREAFFVAAAPGFAIVILFLTTARDYRTVALEVSDAGGRRRKLRPAELIKSLFTTPSLLCLYLALTGIISINATISAWTPSLFNRTEGMPMDQASMRSALVLLAGAVGTITGGMVIDRLKQRSRKMSMLGPAICALVGSIALILAFTLLEGPGRLIALLLGAFFMLACVGPLAAASQSVVHPGMRATTIGTVNIIGQLIGGMGPIVTGVLSDHFGLTPAMAVASVSLLIAALALFIGARYYEADAARIPEIRVEMKQ